MNKNDTNYMGYWQLFLLTGRIVFATASLFVKRTNHNLTLGETNEINENYTL